ncbi:MAG: sigma-54 dependent transcriptional regulator [Desulfobulbaceae bacterium]|nr:sigma-54 dependent transcriptional regulator [Desulfobulbaceae bacterium]HIJ78266.1 sigma-54-dependent Fis family transcriptional regulator [Deltaproteobacteria bacterium]
MKILIVDDDQALCRSLQLQLGLKRHEVRCSFDVHSGFAQVEGFVPELVLLDLNLPDQSGLKALPQFLTGSSLPTVVIMTGEADNNAAVEAMRNGAFDYLRKPLDFDDISALIERVARHRAQGGGASKEPVGMGAEQGQVEMIGGHPLIVEVHKAIGLLSRSKVTVLIGGESGTGKELAARILHGASSPDEPFVAVNCSAVVSTLLESEFFGHEKGAFTGADRLKIGKLEYAKAGTVFLDEIGDMPMDLQGKLLRVLQEEEFVRVGGLEVIPFKARVVAATNCDLEELVRQGRFRRDLYYRLSVSALVLPALRERRQDIPLLVEVLLARIASRFQRGKPVLGQGAMAKLMAYDWPGNVRELENVLTRSVVLSTDAMLAADDLRMVTPEAGGGESLEPVTLAEAERAHVVKTLADLQWNISQAAKRLAISPTTLRKKIADYNIVNPFV